MRRTKIFLVLLFACVGSAGCRVPANIPALKERSVININLMIETEPQGSRVFADNFRFIGEAPVTYTWQMEKLAWSDGKTDFRMLDSGIRIKPGEDLSAQLTVTAKGHKETTTTILIPFSGEEGTVTKKITLEKK